MVKAEATSLLYKELFNRATNYSMIETGSVAILEVLIDNEPQLVTIWRGGFLCLRMIKTLPTVAFHNNIESIKTHTLRICT